MNDEKKWDSFIKQRRALMAISLVLAFAQLAQISLSKINLLGNELVLQSPIAVDIALWAFWFYWLVRFYVYSCEVEAVNKTLYRYNTKLSELIRTNACPLFQGDKAVVDFLKTNNAEITNATCNGIDTYGNVGEGPRLGTKSLTITYKKANGDTGTIPFNDLSLVAPNDYVRPLQRRAVSYLFLRTSVVTDYWLPYLIAAVPVIIMVAHVVRFIF